QHFLVLVELYDLFLFPRRNAYTVPAVCRRYAPCRSGGNTYACAVGLLITPGSRRSIDWYGFSVYSLPHRGLFLRDVTSFTSKACLFGKSIDFLLRLPDAPVQFFIPEIDLLQDIAGKTVQFLDHLLGIGD